MIAAVSLPLLYLIFLRVLGLIDAGAVPCHPRTSSCCCKTTATLLDSAGLSARELADQLGHAKPRMTTDVHLGRQVASTRAADVLESLG